MEQPHKLPNTRDRAYVQSLLIAHAGTLGVRNLKRVPRRKYQWSCIVNGVAQHVCILVNSSDYWTRRLHLLDHTFTLFVVWTHNSCLPLPVIALDSGVYHTAYHVAVDTSRRTRRTSKAFLGQLLCGVQDAFIALETMPYQSQRRYKRALLVHVKRPVGRRPDVKHHDP